MGENIITMGNEKKQTTKLSYEELESAVKEMHQTKGAFLLEVRVEREENVFPMVPAGAPVTDIRLE